MPRAPASLRLQAAASTATATPSQQQASSSSPPQQQQQQAAVSVDSDMVVILASFLCALVCVLGLALVSRCACRLCGRGPAAASSSAQQEQAPPPKGLKKKAIDALPTVPFTAAASSSSDCAICLAEFADGDAVRVMPACRHGFHARCIERWLAGGRRSSCPTCRAPAAAGAAAAAAQPADESATPTPTPTPSSSSS